MCKFFSSIVTRQGEVLYNQFIDSHETLIQIFKLRDDKPMDYFVRCEFYPQDNNDMGDADKYELRVDENFTPEWFEEFRESVTDKMRIIIKNMTVTGDRDCLIGGAYILKDAEVGFLNYCRIVWASNSTVNEMRDNSTVNQMRDNSTVNQMWGNSTVKEMWDNSTVNQMLGNSTVKNDERQK